MAILKNDRNQFLYTSSERVTGARVTITSDPVTSIVVPKNVTTPVPSSVTLVANTTGYTTPSFSWSYRFGNSGSFTSLVGTSSSIDISLTSTWLTSAGTNTAVQYRVEVQETASNIGVNAATYILNIPIIREGTDSFNTAVITLYKRTTENSPPTKDFTLGSNSVYTFSTSQVVGQPTGWSQTIPSSTLGSFLWQISVFAASKEPSYTFSNDQWPNPVLYQQDGATGTNAKVLFLTSTAQVFQVAKSGTTTPSSITFTATPAGALTGTATWSVISGTATLSGTGNTRSLSYSNMTTDTVTVQASITDTSGTYTDTITVVKVREGTDGTPGVASFLTNEAATVPASADGTVISFSGITTSIKIYVGLTDDTDNWTITRVNSTGISSTITGASVSVTGMTVDNGYIDITAIKGPTTVFKRFNISKSKTGSAGVLVYAYQRSTSAPTKPTDNIIVNLNTNSITTPATLSNSWSKTIPAGTAPLYVTTIYAYTTTLGTTASASGNSWSAPVILTSTGSNTAVVFLYARNNSVTSPPTLTRTLADNITPINSTYTFTNGVVTSPPSGWSHTLPSESNGSVVWVIQATANGTGTTDNIPGSEWSNPIVLSQVGTDGAPGAAGTRGSRQLYDSSTAYTSTYGATSYATKATALIAAATAGSIPTTPIEGDTVTFSNTNQTYVYTITYKASTSTWTTPGTVIDGSLLVTGSVTAAKINTNGLTIRDQAGNAILTAGSSLATSTLTIPGTVNSVPSGWLNNNISISSNGTLSGGGGGQVTIGGLGYTGALNATYGATWGTNLSNIPTNVTNALDRTGGTITGRINMSVPDGIFAGTDINTGVYIGNTGLFGKKAGVTTFKIGTDGSAYYYGDLTASQIKTGYLDSARIAADTIVTKQIVAGNVVIVKVVAANTITTQSTGTITTANTYHNTPIASITYTSRGYGNRKLDITGMSCNVGYTHIAGPTATSISAQWYVTYSITNVTAGTSPVTGFLWLGPSVSGSGNTGTSTLYNVGSSASFVVLDNRSMGALDNEYMVTYTIGVRTYTSSVGETANITASLGALTYQGQRFLSVIEYQK